MKGNGIDSSFSNDQSSRKELQGVESIAFVTYLSNLPPSIDHLKRKNGRDYPNHIKNDYRIILSFFKRNQDRLKLVVNDKVKLHEVLKEISEQDDDLLRAISRLKNHQNIKSLFSKNLFQERTFFSIKFFFSTNATFS